MISMEEQRGRKMHGDAGGALEAFLRGITTVGIVFCLTVSLILLASALQSRQVDPLNAPAMNRLLEKLEKDPQDELSIQTVRELDRLMRASFFRDVEFRKTGAIVLAMGASITLLAVGALRSMRFNVINPRLEQAPNPWINMRFVRIGTILGCVVLAFISVAAILQAIHSHSWRTANSTECPDANSDVDGRVGGRKFITPPDVWPMFRGPGGLGVAEHGDPPVGWNAVTGSNILWKTVVPKSGPNSPVVWGRKVFLSGADNQTCDVYCFDGETGRILWQRTVRDFQKSGMSPPPVSEEAGYSAPTMAVDGNGAYVLFATGDCAAFNHQGDLIWRRELGVPDNPYGHASSPVVYRDLLLVQYDSTAGGRLIALACGSGQMAWERWRNVENSWASPIVIHIDQSDRIVLNASPFVAGYDPISGRELWRVECMGGEVAPSPAFDAGMVFVANAYQRLAAIGISNEVSVLWQYEEDLPDVSSPLSSDGLVIIASSAGVVTCLKTSDGSVAWRQEFEEGFISSPVTSAGRVYLTDRSGVTHIFALADEFRELGRGEIGEGSVAVPAIIGNMIYIRGLKHLYCIGTK